MGTTAGQFITALTEGHDVIVIGGLAVIAHGFNRPIKDADVWLAPDVSAEVWAQVVENACDRFPGIQGKKQMDGTLAIGQCGRGKIDV